MDTTLFIQCFARLGRSSTASVQREPGVPSMPNIALNPITSVVSPGTTYEEEVGGRREASSYWRLDAEVQPYMCHLILIGEGYVPNASTNEGTTWGIFYRMQLGGSVLIDRGAIADSRLCRPRRMHSLRKIRSIIAARALCASSSHDSPEWP